MKDHQVILSWIISFFFSPSLALQSDGTVTPYMNGSSVVETVCLRIQTSCVFPEDKLLMRRIAFVESNDGGDPKTYRNGYYGGIWQVDEVMFNLLKGTTVQNFLSNNITAIQTTFSINWNSVIWTDLTKPLYSALAARLYIQYQSGAQAIPRSLSSQADFWKSYFRTSGDKNYFVNASNNLVDSCQLTQSVGADIIFVLDSSGSIGETNFLSMKTFVKDVVSTLNVGTGYNQYRVGLMQFSDAPQTVFTLKDYNTVAEINRAIDGVAYIAQDTYTDAALHMLATTGFSESNGARPKNESHPRIGIVLTDGSSDSPVQTKIAANETHNADINMIAVGIGNGPNLDELNAIASDPKCLNVILLVDFTEVDSLKYIIQKLACSAPIIVTLNQNFTIGIQLTVGGLQNFKITVPPGGLTVLIFNVTGGTATLYIAKSTYPTSNYYDSKIEAGPGQVGAIFIPFNATNGGIAYASLKGDAQIAIYISITVVSGDVTSDYTTLPPTAAPGCGDNWFRCVASGRCIPPAWRCDGGSDCLDSSDEEPRICNSIPVGRK